MVRRIILVILIIAVLAAGAVYLLKNEPKPVPQTRNSPKKYTQLL